MKKEIQKRIKEEFDDPTKIVRESLVDESLNERFETLSDILRRINLDSFKDFVRNQKYNVTKITDIVKAIINWGKLNNRDFEQYEDRDLQKIAEYMQDLVFTHPLATT